MRSTADVSSDELFARKLHDQLQSGLKKEQELEEESSANLALSLSRNDFDTMSPDASPLPDQHVALATHNPYAALASADDPPSPTPVVQGESSGAVTNKPPPSDFILTLPAAAGRPVGAGKPVPASAPASTADVVHARALEESAEGELRRLRSKRDAAQRAAAQAAALDLQVQEQKSLLSSATARRELAEKSASDRAAAEAARAAQAAASAASASAPSAATAVTATTADVPVAAGPGAPTAAPDDALMQRLSLFNKVKEASPGMSDESIVLLVDGHMRQLFPQPPAVQAPPVMPLPPPPVPVAEPSAQLPLLPAPEHLSQSGSFVPQGPLSRSGPGIDAGDAVNRQPAFRGRGRKRCGDSGLGDGNFGDASGEV